MSSDEKINKNQLQPDRYFTPQVKAPLGLVQTAAYEPTPSPETVIFHKKSRAPKKESCCLACLLACFLCCAVKDENTKSASLSPRTASPSTAGSPPPPFSPTSPTSPISPTSPTSPTMP